MKLAFNGAPLGMSFRLQELVFKFKHFNSLILALDAPTGGVAFGPG